MAEASVADGAPLDAMPAPTLDASLDGGAESAECVGDLSSVGRGDFSMTFKIRTTSTVQSSLIGQRAVCMHSKFWQMRMRPNGDVGFELDDGEGDYVAAMTQGVPINDGIEHEIGVYRVEQRLWIMIDSARVPLVVKHGSDRADSLPTSGPAHETPATTFLGPALAPLEWSDATVCERADGTVPFDGTIEPVCIGPGVPEDVLL